MTAEPGMRDTAVMEVCIYVVNVGGADVDCALPAMYEVHDPGFEDPNEWWPACVDCAADCRTQGCSVRTLR